MSAREGQRSRLDLPEFEEFEAERFDLERRQGGNSKPAVYPDRVQRWRCGHASIVPSDPVSRRRWNPVIALWLGA
jgi:hypothetical protein